MECPVIHKVTDHPDGQGSSNASTNGSAKCPITGMSAASEVAELDINTDSIGETPSLKEYKKLKNVMSMITKFYRDGSEKKRQNHQAMTEELEKLDFDLKMCQAQLKALESKPTFSAHPKSKEYRKDLQNEHDNLLKQKTEFTEKQKEFLELYEWSKTIVRVCEWLDSVLDDYCSKHLELPEKMKEKAKPPAELSPEEAEIFFKGLDEITYNLSESQDFFQASVDGRLNKYHNIERQIIEAQLEALKAFPEDNARRQYIEAELTKDLEYVEGNMVENPDALRRRQKMLKNHAEFCKVLKYYKEKLRQLGLIQITERQYDTKFNHYQDE